ncbi:endonuclease 4-like isoform X2 [Impatiens glandulifera]|uniref:endonuclease 4-like isoform X2 n=1 Tax=Impatiens glandulifera TaxID=253017 RepID=UPI001FB0B8BE|nr:endonuclease 4-like isoform X2 [Impatiens glandulifera]
MGRSEFLWAGRVILLLLLQLIPGILGWGKEGHYATCKIAEAYLTSDALAAVKSLLPSVAEGDLANVCSWPDQIRFHYRWSSSLHFCDTPDFRCNYDFKRDCHDTRGQENRCVTAAIYNYTTQLMSYNDTYSSMRYNLTEALMFLAHFMGDVHQPLHVGFVGDQGGNTINVHWYKRKSNLHHIWDTLVIESAMKTFYSNDLGVMIESIQKNITDGWSDELGQWEACAKDGVACPGSYASESISLACKYAYRNATPGTTLNDNYFYSRLPIVEKRLAQGGVRLAAVLNHIFTSKSLVSQQ